MSVTRAADSNTTFFISDDRRVHTYRERLVLEIAINVFGCATGSWKIWDFPKGHPGTEGWSGKLTADQKRNCTWSENSDLLNIGIEHNWTNYRVIYQIYCSKIQVVVYYQCRVVIGWATPRLYVVAHC